MKPTGDNIDFWDDDPNATSDSAKGRIEMTIKSQESIKLFEAGKSYNVVFSLKPT